MFCCPHCGQSNQEGSGFCNNCGEPMLSHECPQCGHLNPLGVFSCAECGASLSASPFDEGLEEGFSSEQALPEPSEEPEWLPGLEEEPPWEPEEVPGEEPAPGLEALEGLVEDVSLLQVGADQAARFDDVISKHFDSTTVKKRPKMWMGRGLSWLFNLILAAAVVGGILLEGEDMDLPITQATTDFYETVESLEEGSVALLSHDYDPGTAAEITPQVSAMLDHLMERGVKIVNLSLTPEGQALADRVVESVVSERYIQGKDYINLGYIAGNETGARFIAESLGPRLSPYPLGAEVGGLEDVDLVVVLAGSQEQLRCWVEQVQAPYQVAMVAGVSAQVDPAARPYYRSGQLKGLLSGLVGAAEYERVSQHPGVALSGMLPQALAHLVIALFILLGNFAYLVGRLKV